MSSKPVVEILVPPVPVPPFHPCEGRLKSHPYTCDSYKQRRAERLGTAPDSDLCGRRAAVKVDGRCYCKTHGGQAALEYLMEQDAKS